MTEQRQWTDRELFELLQTGGEEGVRLFCDGFRRRLLGFYRTQGFNPEQGEELAQDALFKVVVRRDSLDLERDPVAYFWTLVRNLATDARRSAQSSRHLTLEPDSKRVDTVLAEEVHGSGGVSEFTHHVSDGDFVFQVLEDEERRYLSSLRGEPDRTILLMRLDGFTFEEIAAALNATLGLVKMRLQRMKERADTIPDGKARIRLRRNADDRRIAPPAAS